MAKVDFLFVGNEPAFVQRCEIMCKEYEYGFLNIATSDEVIGKEAEAQEALFVLLSAMDSDKEAEIAGRVQVIKQVIPEAYVMVLVDKKVSPEAAKFIKKSGANIVVLENEVSNTSKLEFIASQKIRSSFIPIKASEMAMGTKPDFTLFHLMPLNRRFLAILHANNEISKEKHAKLQGVGEIYVKREDIGKYNKYIQIYMDKSAAGLKSRCRAQFLSLEASYIDLVLMLTDQSEVSSFQYGKELYEKCSLLANDLISGLGAVGDAWDVVNNSSIGTFGSVDRAPSVAAYAGLFSLVAGIGETNDVMLAALIADVGLLELPPQILNKVKSDQFDQLKPDELVKYQKHPLSSLNQALSRRLPIPEKLKVIIQCTHEQYDAKGFPNQIRHEKIPEESQLILFCDLLDKACSLKLGQERVSPQIVRKSLYDKEQAAGNRFGLIFLQKLRPVIEV